MASIDARIPLMIQPVDLADSYSRAMTLRDMMDARKLRALQQQEAEMRLADLVRQQKDQSALRDAYTAAARQGVSTAYSSPELSMSYNHAPEMLQGSPLPVPGMSLGSLTLPKRDISVKGPGVDNQVMLSELSQRAPHLVPQVQQQMAAQGLAQQEQMAKIRESLGKASKQELDNIASRLDISSRMMLAVKQAPPELKPQVYAQVHAQAINSGLVQPGQLPEQYTPQIEGFLDAQIAQGQTVDQFVKAEQQKRELSYKQQQDSVENQLKKSGQDITIRGQNMTDNRMREQNQIARESKVEQQKNQDMTSLTSMNADLDRLATAANELMNHPGLKGITGVKGAFPNVPGGQAANAEALLQTLKSQVAFGVLQNMRNNSKTGGALGQVSDREGQLLESNLASLQKAQSYEEFQKSLKKIIDYSDAAKQRARDAVGRKYSGWQNHSPSTLNQKSAAPAGIKIVRDANGNIIGVE